MDDLIKRLEAATGPDDELDAKIIASVVGGTASRSPINGRWCVYVGEDRSGRPRLWEPRDSFGAKLRRIWLDGYGPTACIDAALTLVPDNCLTMARTLWHGAQTAGYAAVNLYTPSPNRMFLNGCDGISATPALALCIAALKARKEIGNA